MTGLDDVTDAELLGRLPDDADALGEIFRRHRRVVTAYAVRRCVLPVDVDDVVSATFLAVLESGRTFDPSRGPFRPWLIGVAHHQLGALRRKEGRQWSIGYVLSHQRALGEDAVARVEEQIDAARDSAAVEGALAALPIAQRELLWLVGHDHLAPAEAARALGVSIPTFRVRLSRARRALRTAMIALASPGQPASVKETSR